MATGLMNSVIDQLRSAVLRRDGAGLTDGQLLESFISQMDASAFEVLVRRHGPMVLGVCRRVLRNDHDAEDAFQATFLVLVRKAGSVVPQEMVANWLYGVAYRTALKARGMIAKRRVRERQVTEMPEPEAVETDHCWRDLQPLLDEELSQLPDKYRVPIVLCDLEGKTGKEAARQLGWADGTVWSRLARGRMMLAKRLTRHGLALSGGALAAALAQEAASASVPTSLVSSTAKAADLFAVGQAAATGLISAKVAALTEGVLKAMLRTKLRIATAILLALGVLGAGMGVAVTYRTEAAGQATTRGAEPKNDKDRMQGVWQQTSCQGPDEVPDDLVQKTTLVVKDDTITVTAGVRGGYTLTFTLDESKAPKTIDDLLIKPEKRDKPYLGIYSLEGDTLKFCFSDPGSKRPTEFTGKAGSGWTLTVFKRKQPSPARPAPAKAEQPTKKDTDEKKPVNQDQAKQVLDVVLKKEKKSLAGTWKAVSCEANGEKVPGEILKGEVVRWAITENTITWTVANEDKGKDKYTLKPTSSPKAIDLTDKEGRRTPGIYSLDGDTLKVCLNEGSKERPKVFASRPNTHLSVWVFKREKR